ncbi:MAG: 5-formyltetrahydrofolate cyclo-ligase [Kiritimatiellae bacterium]|nr:5-formyltetrahydrofolate cyclo-ligase [Kiritimatiellia bacterium]
MGKDGVRREMRARRKALAPDARQRASQTICAKLVADETIAGACGRGVVAVYLASPEEIDLADFIRAMLDKGVAVAAPRWNGETYDLARLMGLSEDCLRRGPMNILEPVNAELVSPADVAVWIVPGLAFAADGRRIGYGGGWYDRLMAVSGNALKVGVAHQFQIIADLPCEPHDVLLDRVVTPESVI